MDQIIDVSGIKGLPYIAERLEREIQIGDMRVVVGRAGIFSVYRLETYRFKIEGIVEGSSARIACVLIKGKWES